MKTIRRLPIVAVVSLALLVPAQAAGAHVRATGVPASVTPASATRERVKIVDFAFRPRTITISKGTKVTWVNRGTVSHTTTSKTGVWDSGSLAPGETFSHTFRKAGTYRYHCTIHTDMKGKIVVG